MVGEHQFLDKVKYNTPGRPAAYRVCVLFTQNLHYIYIL